MNYKIEDLKLFIEKDSNEIIAVKDNKPLVKRDWIEFECEVCKAKVTMKYFSLRDKHFQSVCKSCWKRREPQPVDDVILANKDNMTATEIGKLVGLSGAMISEIINRYEAGECFKVKKTPEEIEQLKANLEIFEPSLDMITNKWEVIDGVLYIGKRRVKLQERITLKCHRCGGNFKLTCKQYLIKKYEKDVCTKCRLSESHMGFKHSEESIAKMKKTVREDGRYIDEWEDRVCPECQKQFTVRLARWQKRQKYCSEECRLKAFSKAGSQQGHHGSLGPAAISHPSKPERLFEEYLQDNSLQYKKQVSHFGKSFDFELSDGSLVEVDGDYWHKNKEIDITRVRQAKKVVNDKVKEKECREKNKTLYRVWESDVLNGKIELVQANREFEWDEKFLTKEFLLSLSTEELEGIVEIVFQWTRNYFPEFSVQYKTGTLEKEVKSIQGAGSKARKRYWSSPHSSLVGGNQFLKNRFLSYWNGTKGSGPSVYDGFYNDDVLRKIIKYRVGLNRKRETFDISMKNILRGFISGNYAISWFSPSVAYEILNRFCPGAKKVYDPCCGFGARLLGAYANGAEYYFGVDYNPETVRENLNLLQELGIKGEIVFGKGEEVNPNSKFDIAITCPPYFNSEKYSSKMPDYKNIEKEFLVPLINNMLNNSDISIIIVDSVLKYLIYDNFKVGDCITLHNKKSHFGNYKNSEYILKINSPLV